jgi:hypothetical protein
MKLTLFTLPKGFEAAYATKQHNALKSWRALLPTPEIILFGDETGTRQAADKYGALHLSSLERNELGTPLVNHLFRTATHHTRTPYQGFVNADIILDPHLPLVIQRILAWRPRVLVISRRWDLDLEEPVDFSTPDAFQPLATRARKTGTLYSHHGMDLFIFPTGAFDHMPPFSVGWPGAKYDNWLVYAARRSGMPVVDVTHALTNIHQNHPAGAVNQAKAREHWISLDYLGGHGCCYDILDATHTVRPNGSLVRNRLSPRRITRILFRLAQRLRYRSRRRFLGFSYAAKA